MAGKLEPYIWDQVETLPRDELERLQTERLRACVDRVASSAPFYRERLAQAGISAADIRFTTRGGALYAAILDWPQGPVTIAALAGVAVERVTLLGGGSLDFQRGDAGLRVTLPAPGAHAFVPVLRIEGGAIV